MSLPHLLLLLLAAHMPARDHRRMLTYAFKNRLVHDLAAASGMPVSNLSVADVCVVASGAGDARMLEVRTATQHFGKADTKKGGGKRRVCAHLQREHPSRMSLHPSRMSLHRH